MHRHLRARLRHRREQFALLRGRDGHGIFHVRRPGVPSAAGPERADVTRALLTTRRDLVCTGKFMKPDLGCVDADPIKKYFLISSFLQHD